MEPSPTPCHWCYARVSVADEKTGSCSLEWQTAQTQEWLARHKAIYHVGIIDNGVSASTELISRPDGQRLFSSDVSAGDVIVVAKLDRLFRDVIDFRTSLRLWQQRGVRLVSCTEPFDFSTLQGILMGTMVVTFAEYELGLIGERTRAALETRRAAGLRTSTEAPYGWRWVPFGPPRPDGSRECRSERDEREQRIIARIVDLRGRGSSLREIASQLTRDRTRTRHGGPWAHSTVSDILADYAREIQSGPPSPDNDSEDPDNTIAGI